MIEVKTKLGDTNVSVSGSLPMLCTDTTQIVRAIYDAIREHDEEAGKRYKVLMTESLCRLAFKGEGETPELDVIIENLEKLVKTLGGKNND